MLLLPSFFVGRKVDECNLMYVAVTRARYQVIMSETLHRLLKLAGEYHLYPSSLSKVFDEREMSVCINKARMRTDVLLHPKQGDELLSQCVMCEMRQPQTVLPVHRHQLTLVSDATQLFTHPPTTMCLLLQGIGRKSSLIHEGLIAPHLTCLVGCGLDGLQHE